MDYNEIFRRSWAIVKREKVFWLFGMILAAFSGGGGGSGSNYQEFGKLFQDHGREIPEKGEKVSQVLGALTTDPSSYFSQLFTSIPLSFWLAFIFGVLTLAIYAIALAWFLANWSRGALFSLALVADLGKPVDLKMGSNFGRKSWGRLLLSSLIITVGFGIVVALTGFIGLLLFVVVSAAGLLLFQIILGILGFLFIIAALVAMVIAAVWSAMASLVIAIENLPLRPGLTYGWHLTKKYFWQALILGILHLVIGIVVTVVVFSIVAAIVVLAGLVFLVNQPAGIALGLAGGVPLVILFMFSLLGFGILKAFTTINWAILYGELRKREDFPKYTS